MAYKFNPFTGNFDDVGTGNGSVPDPLTLSTLTVTGLLTAEHIHGNIAGTVYIHVKNLDTVPLAKGTPFYVSGTVGASDRVEIKAADASDPAKGPAIGLVEDTLAVNGEGNGVLLGEIFKYNTLDAGWSTNDPLYVAAGGGLTNTKPTSGFRQVVGYVGRVHDQTGTIVVVSNAADPVAGSDTQIQYNDDGGFGASVDLTWDDTAKELGVGGDINLDDGGTYTTTLQMVTPTTDRTISFPNATGTVALVAGSNGQFMYNNAGALGGLSTFTTDGTNLTALGRLIAATNGAASAPPVSLTGTWFTGGTGTTTKPQFLIEPAGTTSTTWSTNGTGLGVNAPSGFSGNLLDLLVDGTRRFAITASGAIEGLSTINANSLVVKSGARIELNTVSGYVTAWNLYAGINGAIGFGNGTYGNSTGAGGPFLNRDAADTFAQRRGTNAQTYRLYNTYTDASNYERGFLQWNSGVFEIGTEGAGTGSEQPVRITAATLNIPNLPEYADDSAAGTGGLVAGDVYKTSTGELRIKL